MMLHVRVARASFPPLERTRIENLACSSPSESGLEVTQWAVRTLEQVVVEKGIVTSIHYSSIAMILRQADLQPHRQRYWKTTVWDEEAIERSAKILWCYERVDWLWERGEVVLSVDEKPNIQVLEREPRKLMRPGEIEQQEFEYVRHGTVNLLSGLTLHTGQMWSECLERNDGEHFRSALARCLQPFHAAKKVHLILDGGPSHTSHETRAFFKDLCPKVRVLFTPPHASWLDQAELLLRAFSQRYLRRGSWESREQMIDHIRASTSEYNRRFAHQFDWSWTRRDFRDWVAPRSA